MKRFIKIIISAMVSLIVFTAGIARFHHHDTNDHSPCFCVSVAHDNHHHNNDGDEGHSSPSDDLCPLHLDLFKISEIQKIIDHDHHCDHCQCDIYTPLVIVSGYSELIAVFSDCRRIVPDLFESAPLVRRGPPSIA